MPSATPQRQPSISSAELAKLLGAELLGSPSITLTHIDALDRAGPGGLSFIRSARFARDWAASKASAALVTKDAPLADLSSELSDGPRALLIVPDADLAMVKVIEFFAPRPAPPVPGIHPSAVVDPSAKIDPSASIGPNCTIAPGASIGPGTRLTGNVYIGQDAAIGARSTLHAGVSVLDRCIIGNDCVLHAGVAIGADGFGYRPSPDGPGLIKIPHIGNVILSDHVEIGANSCIDRAKFGSTSIGSGTKIDNLVQVGHGCRIGRSCVICGHVGISGSVTIGDGVIIGGKVGIADNIEIGDGAKIAAFAGVINNVPAGATWMGAPAGPAGEMRRSLAALRRLGKQRGQARAEGP